MDNKCIRLHLNENPYGASVNVSLAIEEALKNISMYPDSNCIQLKNALAKHLEITTDQICIDNSSALLLLHIAKTFSQPGTKIIYPKYSFIIFGASARYSGAIPVCTKGEDYACSFQSILSAMDGSVTVIYLANPNNPTGELLDNKEIEEFLGSVPKNVLVVLDEAYYEYAKELAPDYCSGITMLDKYPNLIIVRTFSKAYGLAGLRIGYCVSSKHNIKKLLENHPPFLINRVSEAAAYAALEDQEHLRLSIRSFVQERKIFYNKCAELNLITLESFGNFIPIDLGDEAVYFHKSLNDLGILTHRLIEYDMPTFVRVTVGSTEDSLAFFKSLNEIMNKRDRWTRH